MLYQRMLDRDNQPTEDELSKTIGEKSSLWDKMRKYLEEYYDFIPELVFYGKKHGWTIRYRKSGKTLCSLFPEKDAFTVLVVLGKKEVEKMYSLIDKLNSDVRSVFENTEQLHDGRWLWIRVLSEDDIESIKLLMNAKRKPKKHN